VILAELILIFITNRRRHKQYEKYEQYKTIPTSESDSELQLTTCRRCKGDVYNNVWTGYQTGASPPPPSYWPDATNAEVQTKSWQNYKVTGSPVENTHYQNCDDNYRCRQYGISTGVQGKIF